MTNKLSRLQKILSFSIMAVAIYSVIPYIKTNASFLTFINNTFVWWLVIICILSAFFISNKYFFKTDQKKLLMCVKLYLIWNVISIIRGIFIAETYWDWKGLLENSMTFMIPIVAYVATNMLLMQRILHFYVRYALLIFVFFAFFIINGAYGFYLIPIGFITLFLPLIKRPWYWIVLALAIFVILSDLSNRSNVIKFAVPILLSFIYYFRNTLSTHFFELMRKLLFVLPILLFIVAIYADFNIFKIDEYIKGDYASERIDSNGRIVDEDLKADTRTFIYTEVLNTAKVYDTWWFGRSPALGNISEAFGEGDMNRRGERMGNEVAILNVFNWTGIIGVLFFFITFYHASYFAINQSNNIFSKILGLFIAFRWLYAWVEDVNNFSITTFFIWMMIGMCLSKSFRKMNDQEVKIWVRGIFEKQLNFKKTKLKAYPYKLS